jgi:hypothetical protein
MDMQYLWCVMVIVIIGTTFHFVSIWRKWEIQLTWLEFGVGLGAFCVAGLWVIIWLFDLAAVQSLVTYHENWSGYEKHANFTITKCDRDGWCHNCYDCDPYTVQVSYECGGTVGTGKNARYVSKTCWRDEIRYHSCPYTTEEWTFDVDTTLGNVPMASHWLPTDPDKHRWRWYESVPSYLPSGIPQPWQQVADRLKAGHPGPVVFRHDYPNYILAADYTILKHNAVYVQKYKQLDLLPALNSAISGYYTGNRVYFVGTHPDGDWVTASNYFNAALGMEKQGDLYLIIVDAAKITDPDSYTSSIVAYWQSAVFARDTLSKNAVVVVLGTDDNKTVKWSRGATGMPSGNDVMLIDLRQDLVGKPLDPKVIFGEPSGTVYPDGDTLKVKVNHTNGILEQVLWGKNGFHRISMREYQYLKHEIKPTSSQLVWLYLIVAVLSAIAFYVLAALGPQTFHNLRPYYRRDR